MHNSKGVRWMATSFLVGGILGFIYGSNLLPHIKPGSYNIDESSFWIGGIAGIILGIATGVTGTLMVVRRAGK